MMMDDMMLPCLLECDSGMDFGPPPNLIMEIPPPPIPAFLQEPVDYLVASNGTCDLCGWAIGDDAQLVQIISRYPVIEDLWYFGILSAVIGLILISILITVAALRCREAKVKPIHQTSCKSSLEKVHSEPEIVHHPLSSSQRYEDSLASTKTMWSSIKSGNGGGYVLQHHPLDPYHHQQSPLYEKVDYGSIVYSCPMVPKPSSTMLINGHPPPLPAIPPPSFCPSLRPNSEEHYPKKIANSGYYDHILLHGTQQSGLPMVTRISKQHMGGRTAPL